MIHICRIEEGGTGHPNKQRIEKTGADDDLRLAVVDKSAEGSAPVLRLTFRKASLCLQQLLLSAVPVLESPSGHADRNTDPSHA